MLRFPALLRLALAWLFMAGTALASPGAPQLRDLAVLEDAEGRETIASVALAPGRFTPLPSGMLAAGYSRSVRWVRFTVVAPAGEWWLDVMPPYLDDLRLYSPAPGHPGEFTERRAGDRLPFAGREVPYRGFVFRLLQPDEAPVTHYLRLETSSSSILVPRLYSAEGFLAAVASDYGLQLATLGALVVVIVLNAVAWYWLRDTLALWFLAFIGALSLNVAGNSDIPAQFLFATTPRACDHWTTLASLAAIAAGNAFYKRLFAVDRRRPVLHRIYVAMQVAPLVAMPVAFAGYYPEAMRLLLPAVIAMNVIGLALAVQQWRQGRPGAGLVLLAVAISFGGLAAFVLVLLGAYTSHDVLLYGLQVTSLGSILALHVALGARSRAQRDERLRLDYLAHHDPLTQLPNRTLFFDRVSQAISRSRRQRTPFALLLIDLDRFKPVNDAWGHPAGDLVLKAVARRLEDAVRDSDTVGRIGGDEFVALLPDIVNAAAAERVARKMRRAVAEPIVADGHTVLIDCSIGIALYPEHGHDEVSLVNNADRAMYDAKREAAGSVRTFRPPQPITAGAPP